MDSIGNIIESDVGLAATVLRVVNSPYYGLLQHVESPSHASALLGVEVIKNILLSEKVLNQIKQSSTHSRRISELNIQANIRAVLANRFARLADLDKRSIDHCHISGLMSTLGDLVLESGLLKADDDKVLLAGPDLIGSSIIAKWRLPDRIVEAVCHQNDEQLPVGEPSPMLVLHTIRRLEQHFYDNDEKLDEAFEAQYRPGEHDFSAELDTRWFRCFCDYHNDLKQAA
jgi:HD-like signal output (HDOD) protein